MDTRAGTQGWLCAVSECTVMYCANLNVPKGMEEATVMMKFFHGHTLQGGHSRVAVPAGLRDTCCQRERTEGDGEGDCDEGDELVLYGHAISGLPC